MKETTSLRNGNPVGKDSHIASLNPVLVDGLVRSKGRVSFGAISRCSVILPRDIT